MPLLKKKTLEKAQADEFLRDEEEVFHCVMTNEIFRDYDEFAERTILCNSMVWTCSMTGKSNLTYEEALQSEENAKKVLGEFPQELHIPILYIATLVKGSFAEMVEDVFLFIKDHFFIGESVEACFANKWDDYKVVCVIAPTAKELEDAKNKSTGDDGLSPALLYKYELIGLNSASKEKRVMSSLLMRRRRGTYNREKSKLFLKQHVEPKGSSIGIKKSALESFGINAQQFGKIFAGPPPSFNHKVKTTAANGKRVRQETLAKFLSKNNIILPKSEKDRAENAAKAKLREIEMEKQRERKQYERNLKKQRHVELGVKLRDWNNPLEDLLLEDQKVLPTPTAIQSKIPDKYLGDALCVMEFVHTFSTVLNARNYFASGISLTVMEKIILETRVGSPMSTMIEMLLVTIFKLEAAERENYGKIALRSSRWGASKETLAADRCQLWVLKNYGNQLFNIEIDICALTELLRLHLLNSGNNVSEAGIKWRAQYRGGYESEEDPAIQFRLHNPHILKSLGLHHVCQLSMPDKLKLLDCLVNQLLTYKELRDVVDQNMDKMKENKNKLKMAQANERKRQTDTDAQVAQLKKGSVTLPADQARVQLDEIQAKAELQKSDFEVDCTQLRAKIYRHANFLGYDRAYRAYFKLHSVPALAINQDDYHQGACLPEMTQHVPELVDANRKEIMNYLQKMADEMNSSDKENEPKQNGVETKTGTALATLNELLMCSTDPTTCPVHTLLKNTPKWYVVRKDEQLDQLIATLNKRGLNEKELARKIQGDYNNLLKNVSRTPLYVTDAVDMMMSTRFHKDDNWGYTEEVGLNEALRLTVVDRILTLEEKLFDGNLGGIHKDRDQFRELVEDNKYDEIDALARARAKWHIKEEEDMQIMPNDWLDPGAYLNQHMADIDSEDSEVESDEILLTHTTVEQKSIKFLAHALAQVALSVKLNFIAKPLGQFYDKQAPRAGRQNCIVLWEQSLLNATSYSQILLHMHILDSAIAWSKSTLVVKCKTCKSGNIEKKILLCDYCNDGYHIYCLRPKLNSVPVGNWYCVPCKERIKIEEAKKKVDDEAKKKRMKIQEEGVFLDSDGEPQTCFVCGVAEIDELLQCVACLNVFHLECTNLKRSVRGAWTCAQCKEASEREAQQSNGDQMQRRSGRSNETSVDLPLNNAAWQEVLRDIIACEDGWPFIKPVHKHDVPDYYEVIKKPMDFGTIKYKLNMGDYQYDDEVHADCQLVFENCHTYNTSGDEVYQCGSRLLKFYVKKCKELKLDFEVTISMEIIDDGVEPPRKSRRTR